MCQHNLVLQCLRRDEGWKDFYRQEVMGYSQYTSDEENLKKRVNLASAERTALNCLLNGDYDRACELLVEAGDKYTTEMEGKAKLFQRAARYIYPQDKSRALELQKKAREWNPKLIKPLQGAKYRKQSNANAYESDLVMQWFSEFQQENAAIAAMRDLKDRLRFESNAETFEEAIKDLGQVLGAIAERPENEYGGKAPDDLWLFPKAVFLIEAKNTSQAEYIPKIDGIGQLFNSREWGNKHYPELRRVPIICHRQDKADPTSSPSPDMRVLTPTLLDELLNEVENFIVKLAQLSATERNRARINELLNAHGLTFETLISRYTRPLAK